MFPVCVLLSTGVHAAVAPWNIFPSGLEVQELEGDVGIPLDLFEEPAPVEAPSLPAEPAPKVEEVPEALREEPKRVLDAGAGVHDAGAEVFDASLDGLGALVVADAGDAGGLVMRGMRGGVWRRAIQRS
ncbi:MAG: hypothetical protein WCI05_15305 [Myxococcales bacterium]